MWSKLGTEQDEETIFSELPHGLRSDVGWHMSRSFFDTDQVCGRW